MYTPPAFKEDNLTVLHAMMTSTGLATFVTATENGLMATPLPLMIDPHEGPYGVLHGHLARANPQWTATPMGEAMAVFMGPDAYITPSWYTTKQENGRVVPTWNYAAVHAYGPVTFFEDEDRLLGLVSRLTELHEQAREQPWAVTDAPEKFVKAQLRGIVGMRMPITRLEGKRKMSQNRNASDRAGVVKGLSGSDRSADQAVAAQIPVSEG